MVVFGGLTSNYTYSDRMYLYHFDTPGRNWEDISGGAAVLRPSARAGHAFAARTSSLFIFGGFTQPPPSAVNASAKAATTRSQFILRDLWEYNVGKCKFWAVR